MQLKHLPICFLIVAAICLAGAVNATANPAPADPLEMAEAGKRG